MEAENEDVLSPQPLHLGQVLPLWRSPICPADVSSRSHATSSTRELGAAWCWYCWCWQLILHKWAERWQRPATPNEPRAFSLVSFPCFILLENSISHSRFLAPGLSPGLVHFWSMESNPANHLSNLAEWGQINCLKSWKSIIQGLGTL